MQSGRILFNEELKRANKTVAVAKAATLPVIEEIAGATKVLN